MVKLPSANVPNCGVNIGEVNQFQLLHILELTGISRLELGLVLVLELVFICRLNGAVDRAGWLTSDGITLKK